MNSEAFEGTCFAINHHGLIGFSRDLDSVQSVCWVRGAGVGGDASGGERETEHCSPGGGLRDAVLKDRVFFHVRLFCYVPQFGGRWRVL